MTDDTTTARLDTTDPDRPRGDVGLGDARREALVRAIGAWQLDAALVGADLDFEPSHLGAAIAPLVAGWLGEERAAIAAEIEAWGRDEYPSNATMRGRYEHAARIARGEA